MQIETRQPGLRGRADMDQIISPGAKVRIVDIGARRNVDEPIYAPLQANNYAHVVAIEADEDAHVQNADEAIRAVIGDGGPAELNHCASPYMTSLLRPWQMVARTFRNLPRWMQVQRTEPVQTTRLADIKQAREAHMLCLDIQGGEHDALESASLDSVMLVQAEVSWVPIYCGQLDASSLMILLGRSGLVPHKLLKQNCHMVAPLAPNSGQFGNCGQLVDGDMVFIRDWRTWGQCTAEQLEAAALALAYCYESYDLSTLALHTLDGRDGGDRAERYCAWLRGHGAPVTLEVA